MSTNPEIPDEGSIAAVLAKHSKGSRPQPQFVDVEWVCSCGGWTGPKFGRDPDPYGWEKHLQAAITAALPHLRVQETQPDGLREALDSLCRDQEAEAEGGGFCDIDTIWPSQIRAVLAAHPAPARRLGQDG